MNLTVNEKYAIGGIVVIGLGIFGWEMYKRHQAALPTSSTSAAHAVQPPGQGAYTNASYTTGGAMSTLDVQKALNSLGAAPPLTEDGINGPLTTNAVEAFQKTMGIQVDGVVGPQTVAAINTALNALGTAHAAQSGQ